MASPKVIKTKQKELNFYDALREIMEGNIVTKKEWKNRKIYGIINYGRLMIHKEDGNFYDWILSDGDVYGEDYVVL